MYANHYAEPSMYDRNGSIARQKPRMLASRSAVLACLAIAALTCAGWASAATTWTVTSNADDLNGATCNLDHTCVTLRDAIFTATDGDTIVFDRGMLPTTIALNNAKPLSIVGKSLTINGPGYDKLSINGRVASRVFDEPDSSGSNSYVETISGLTITFGRAVASDGSNATTPGTAGAGGGSSNGGCIYVGNHYTVNLNFDRLTACYALGGHGGNGAMGNVGVPGDNGSGAGGAGHTGGTGNGGGGGGDGGNAYGAAVYVSGILLADSSTFEQNFALGGSGGNGAKGGTGGAGGNGVDSACVGGPPCYPTGPGGDGGGGGTGGPGGWGGAAGSGFGGAIYIGTTGSITLTNSTLADNEAGADFAILFGPAPTPGAHGSGGDGGAGGHGGNGLTDGADGATGYAGNPGGGSRPGGGSGGALAFADLNTGTGSTLKHTTIAFNQTTGGTAGFYIGATDGAGISNGIADTLNVWNSIVASNMANPALVGTSNHDHVISNCHGGVTTTNDNLEDSNATDDCGFNIHGDPNFAPPVGGSDAYSWGGNGMPVVMPLAPSPAINGAAVHLNGLQRVGGCALQVDERGERRPYQHTQQVGGGGFIIVPDACDLGAVQNDPIFHNGFEQ